ncbi:hypothetical protein NIES4071_24650 [Calothrix sp. NIES-4071]|nr:hypothetical protein NIES4071_24650 [Calothrix sp. NIES-4071]BAZ56788.1 hypothetical protein NIES4105_24590 [Calothrix sp. NIES-4105]
MCVYRSLIRGAKNNNVHLHIKMVLYLFNVINAVVVPNKNIASLPLPNSWAINIASSASKRFKIPKDRVYILSAEQTFDPNRGTYFWNVAVDVKQNTLVTYELDISGKITKQP